MARRGHDPVSESRDEGGVKTSGKDSADGPCSAPPTPCGNNSRPSGEAWILNAMLESLSSKVERGDRKRSEVASGDGPDQPRRSPDASGDSGWHSRLGGSRRLASPVEARRLRSRADRAERHAAVAINDASVSFRVALEAMRNASIARMKADEACLDRCRPLICSPPAVKKGSHLAGYRPATILSQLVRPELLAPLHFQRLGREHGTRRCSRKFAKSPRSLPRRVARPARRVPTAPALTPVKTPGVPPPDCPPLSEMGGPVENIPAAGRQ